MRTCFLNNYYMKNERSNRLYQTVIIDLALAGALDRGIAEQLLGYKIPDSITSPVSLEKKKASKKSNLIKSEKTEDVTE